MAALGMLTQTRSHRPRAQDELVGMEAKKTSGLDRAEEDLGWDLGKKTLDGEEAEGWPWRDLNMILPAAWNYQEALLPKADVGSTTARSSPTCFHVTRGGPQPGLDITGGLNVNDLKRQELTPSLALRSQYC